MDHVDAVGVLGAAPGVRDQAGEVRAADRVLRLAADAVEHLLRRLPDRHHRRGGAPAAAAAAAEEHGPDRRGAGAGGGRCRGALRRLRDSVSRDEEGSRRARRAARSCSSARDRRTISSRRRRTSSTARCSSAAAGRSGGCFPGVFITVLAIFGLFMRPRASIPIVIAYLLAMVVSFEMSLGLSGYSYRFLFDYVPVFGGFRAVARLGIFVVFFLSVLGAFGYAALAAGHAAVGQAASSSSSASPCSCSSTASGGSTWSRIRTRPPPLYAWLAKQPPGVVASLPMPKIVPGHDPRISYMSTFHWKPIINGYSGFVPNWYLERMEDLKFFPDDHAIARLRRDNVRYLVVHLVEYLAGRTDQDHPGADRTPSPARDRPLPGRPRRGGGLFPELMAARRAG